RSRRQAHESLFADLHRERATAFERAAIDRCRARSVADAAATRSGAVFRNALRARRYPAAQQPYRLSRPYGVQGRCDDRPGPDADEALVVGAQLARVA